MVSDTITPPDRIWIDAWGGNWSPVSGGTQGTPYVREDLTGWRSMDSAPLDGTAILAFAKKEGWSNDPQIVCARWYRDARSWFIYGCGPTGYSPQWLDRCTPTHWMPLPTPPEARP